MPNTPLNAAALIVFDLDGTLVDSRAHIARAVRETARIAGLPEPSAAAIPRVIGLSLHEALSLLFPGSTPATLTELHAVYRRIFAAWRAQGEHHEPLFDGSHDIIAELEGRGFVLGIATGKGRGGVDYILDKHRLTGRFATIQTPDIAPGKPDPTMLHQAMADTGVGPARTIMVGDTTFDMAMAGAAKTQALGVSWGNHGPNELRESGAHAVIDRWGQFMETVDELLAP